MAGSPPVWTVLYPHQAQQQQMHEQEASGDVERLGKGPADGQQRLHMQPTSHPAACFDSHNMSMPMMFYGHEHMQMWSPPQYLPQPLSGQSGALQAAQLQLPTAFPNPHQAPSAAATDPAADEDGVSMVEHTRRIKRPRPKATADQNRASASGDDDEVADGEHGALSLGQQEVQNSESEVEDNTTTKRNTTPQMAATTAPATSTAATSEEEVRPRETRASERAGSGELDAEEQDAMTGDGPHQIVPHSQQSNGDLSDFPAYAEDIRAYLYEHELEELRAAEQSVPRNSVLCRKIRRRAYTRKHRRMNREETRRPRGRPAKKKQKRPRSLTPELSLEPSPLATAALTGGPRATTAAAAAMAVTMSVEAADMSPNNSLDDADSAPTVLTDLEGGDAERVPTSEATDEEPVDDEEVEYEGGVDSGGSTAALLEHYSSESSTALRRRAERTAAFRSPRATILRGGNAHSVSPCSRTLASSGSKSSSSDGVPRLAEPPAPLFIDKAVGKAWSTATLPYFTPDDALDTKEDIEDGAAALLSLCSP